MQIHLARHLTVDPSLAKIIILDEGIGDALRLGVAGLLIRTLFALTFALEVLEVVQKL